MKQSHLTAKVSLTKTLWQQMIIMGLEVEITFGQNHNIHRILVVSILSLEFSVDLRSKDTRGTPCEQGLFTDNKSFNSSICYFTVT
jgi:hypothetical protein